MLKASESNRHATPSHQGPGGTVCLPQWLLLWCDAPRWRGGLHLPDFSGSGRALAAPWQINICRRYSMTPKGWRWRHPPTWLRPCTDNPGPTWHRCRRGLLFLASALPHRSLLVTRHTLATGGKARSPWPDAALFAARG